MPEPGEGQGIVLVTVSVVVQKIPYTELLSLAPQGCLVTLPKFFDTGRGANPFAMAVAEALNLQGIAVDDGCFIRFESEGDIPIITVPAKKNETH